MSEIYCGGHLVLIWVQSESESDDIMGSDLIDTGRKGNKKDKAM